MNKRKLSICAIVNWLKTLSFLLMIFALSDVFATHNRAGEIVYRRLQANRYQIEVITYTEIGDNNADRPELGINYDDGSGIDSISRTSTSLPFPDNQDIQKNIYRTEHTFPGPGTYVISMLDPNRNGDVINIPNSIDESFYIESVLSISLSNHNDSPLLLNPPIDFACVGIPYYHSPAAWDPDGDSLVYSLAVCKGNNGLPILGYKYPDDANSFYIDPNTGVLTWDVPAIMGIGEYNIAILIKEYRTEKTGNGQVNVFEVGSILRDMQIEVFGGCNNWPPVIYNLQDYCVMAGENLNYSVFATDSLDDNLPGGSNGTRVEEFVAYGGPFEIDPVATAVVTGLNPKELNFNWNTSCNHVQKTPYTVTYKATDNGNPALSNYETSEILVVAPPVENVQAMPQTSFMDITWEKEVCSDAIGYLIYRKNEETGFVPDDCETGVPARLGYQLIYQSDDINETAFQDNNDGRGLIPGETYCYLIVAYFPDGAQSYASTEVCTELEKDVPILTHASVLTTEETSGSILVGWSPPTEHDVVLFPGPYKYKVYRTTKREQDNYEFVGSTSGFTDTSFIDNGLNTETLEYMYKIEMLDLSTGQEKSMGFSASGTSIYLRSVSKDNRLILEWNEFVPWRNTSYEIFKLQDGDTLFLGSTADDTFIDSNLHNGREYCYFLRSNGEYSIASIGKPFVNYSQVHCNVPVDLQAPCPPELTAEVDDCQTVKSSLVEDPSLCGGVNEVDGVDRVYLRWSNPNNSCDTTDDVIEYFLYSAPTINGDFEIIYRGLTPNDTSFLDLKNNTRAGCYYITAIDSFGNASPVVDTVCVDNCLLYELPNVFTPNNDGVNDFFRPFPYCFVDEVRMTIMNRWGDVVFETRDPDILWDGTHYKQGEKVKDGVYFYTCVVEQISVQGILELELKGVVHILGVSESKN